MRSLLKISAKLREADVERKRQMKTVADFLKQVLPSAAAASSPPTQLKASHSGTQTEQEIKSVPPAKRRRLSYKTPTPTPSTVRDVIYETLTSHPALSIKRDIDNDDDVSTDDQQIEREVLDFGAMTVGALASPYMSPYLYESKSRGLDTEYGIRREGGVFMIVDSQISVDRDGNIHIKDVEFPATKGLWELLTLRRWMQTRLPVMT